MLKKRLLSLGMIFCVLAAAGCSAQKEPAKPDYDKREENDVSPEPAQTPSPEVTAAPTAEPEQTAEPENIFDRIPTEGNVWKINEIEREYGLITDHNSPDYRHVIFHEMTREEVLAYFGMKLDLADILPDLQEDPDRKYGFNEYRSVDGRNVRIELQESFYYCDKESLAMYPWQWAQYVMVDFAEGGLPDFSNLNALFSEELRNHWEPEVSVIQGQEVRIVHYTVKREDVVYGEYYFADFFNNDLGVAIEALGMEWEDIKKVIEYLVFYALKREGG